MLLNNTSFFLLAEVANVHGRVHANDGKTELSLIHFASNHPEWKPPPSAARFLDDIRDRVCLCFWFWISSKNNF